LAKSSTTDVFYCRSALRLRSSLRQCGCDLWTSLPTPYPSFRFAELGNGVGYYLPRLSALEFRVGKVSWLPVAFLENQCQKGIWCSPVSQLRVDSSLFVFDQCDQCSSAVRCWCWFPITAITRDHGDYGDSPSLAFLILRHLAYTRPHER